MRESSAFVLFFVLAACSSPAPARPAHAQGFDGDLAGWQVASTGGVGPHATWLAHADAKAPSPPNVLSMTAQNHTAEDRFNLYWTAANPVADGRIEVLVRADGGEVDQGGGPMWRVQDANNYYLCRFNPLESNFRVYVVKDRMRRQLATTLVAVRPGDWHKVEATFVGDRITCWLNGQKLLEATDATILGAGGQGLWTKADARTSFDELVVEAKK